MIVPRNGNALETLGAGGPFAELPATVSEQLLRLAELISVPEERDLVRQHHRGHFFYLLVNGEVEFSIEGEGLGSALAVGRCKKPWTPVGWSAFRTPFRYATTVSTTRYSEFLRFRTDDLARFFQDDTTAATAFFDGLALGAEDLLIDARERLLGSLRTGSAVSHWARDEHTARLTPRASAVPPEASFSPVMDARENMVTNAAPDAVAVLRRSHFFEQFDDHMVGQLAREVEVRYFCRGDVLQSQGEECRDLMVLADGRVRLEYTGSQGRTAVLRTLGKPGQILAWCFAGKPRVASATLRAVRDGAVIRIDNGVLRRLFAVHPSHGARFGRAVLWLIGRHLKVARAHLVSESFDREVLAVENLVEQSRTELSVASPLHKIPHLLRATVTLEDALSIVDKARSSRCRTESHLAELCYELLAPIRKEHRFFSSLQSAFEEVVSAPENVAPEQLRRANAETFIRMFSQIPSRIAGLENLPNHSGHIFVFNHLRNHEYNTLPNGFQLTLDSHFISAMVLHRHYGDPGVRVVRRSRAAEYGHQQYYDRLGHVSVYTRESDAPEVPRSQLIREFFTTAATHLERGQNIVLAPEGTSYSTEESPGPLKAGAFRLALAVKPEPLIVPIAVAHFDRRLDHAVPAVVIEKPFLVSRQISNPDDPVEMENFLLSFRERYRLLVERARRLSLS